MKTPKIAVFYDWLNCWGGAERLLLSILKIFPNATLFTTIYDPKKTAWLPKHTKIIISSLSKITKTNNLFVGLTQALAVEQFNFSKYDIVISLTSLNGKAILTPPHTLHICYCLNPNRHLYQKKYSSIFNLPLKILKKNDHTYAQRPDVFFTISKFISSKIQKLYQKTPIIIYPGIDTNKFKPNKNTKPIRQKYYLAISRFVPYKKVDLLIKTFTKNKKNLYIVGLGKRQNYLKNLAQNHLNIKFLGKVSNRTLVSLYTNCQALICPQLEDFGLSPLEVQACGRPVIAYNGGGIKETIINQKTGIFFNKQTQKSLSKAIILFESGKINPADCRQQANNFSQTGFMLNFKKEVLNQWQQYRKNQKNNTS